MERRDQMKRLSSDRIIGIAATAIALASLVLSVWAGIQTRHHNRLSVMPKLSVLNNFTTEPPFGWVLSNKGLGPAIVKKVTIFVDNKPVPSDKYGGWDNATKQLGIRHFVTTRTFVEESIKAGEKIVILEIPPKEMTNERMSQLRNVIERLKIEIVYESFYGDQQACIASGQG
jgi:hypothetical protein